MLFLIWNFFISMSFRLANIYQLKYYILCQFLHAIRFAWKDVGCSECGMLRKWHIEYMGCWQYEDVGFSECGMFRMWNAWEVGCSGCAIFGMCDVRDVECWACGMLRIRDVEHVRCLACGIFGLCDVRDVGCLFTKCCHETDSRKDVSACN